MNAYINYFLEANLSLCFLLVVYLLFLKNETDFRFKRIYVLIAVIASVTLPLLHLNSDGPLPSLSSFVPSYWLPEIIVAGNTTTNAANDSTGLTVWFYISALYAMGVLLFSILFAIQVVKLVFLISRSKKYLLGKYLIIESPESKATFSFFGYIFIGQSSELSNKEKQQIIQHEAVHASRYHSLDLLLINLLLIIFWFNPWIRTYRKIFIQLHEFEADARAVENHDVNEYCNLLARVALQSADFRFANHFTNSLTIKRIHMIRTVKKKISRWKMISMLVLVTLFFYFITGQEQVVAQSTPQKAEEPKQAEASKDDLVYTVAEKMPELKDKDGLGGFLSKNISYPKTARQNKIEGTVVVSFIVEKNGNIGDVQVLKGVEKTLDDEALRVVKMTTWTPAEQNGKTVRARFVLPIKFKL